MIINKVNNIKSYCFVGKKVFNYKYKHNKTVRKRNMIKLYRQVNITLIVNWMGISANLIYKGKTIQRIFNFSLSFFDFYYKNKITAFTRYK
jgi:hypothetical protein